MVICNVIFSSFSYLHGIKVDFAIEVSWENAKSFESQIQRLKLVSAIFYQNFIFWPNYSPSKIMKNVFYFI